MVGAVGKDGFGEALLEGFDRAKVDRSGVAILDGLGSGMSVAIFDDEGDYCAVMVGAILGFAPDKRATRCSRTAKFSCFRRDCGGGQRGCRPPRPRARTDDHYQCRAGARLCDAPSASHRRACGQRDRSGDARRRPGVLARNRRSSRRGACLEIQSRVVTAGGDGVAFGAENGQCATLPGIKVKVASTHGAGDLFVGALAARLALATP